MGEGGGVGGGGEEGKEERENGDKEGRFTSGELRSEIIGPDGSSLPIPNAGGAGALVRPFGLRATRQRWGWTRPLLRCSPLWTGWFHPGRFRI